MKKELIKDNFGIVTRSGNHEQIINFLKSNGYNTLIGVGSENNWHYYVEKNSKEVDYQRLNPTPNTFTLEQFKEQFADMKENGEIIGYRLIKPEFRKAAVCIEGFIETGWSNIENRTFTYADNSQAISKWKDAEVLDVWFEPVYKERITEETVLIGQYFVKITSDGEITGTKSYKIYEWENIYNSVPKKGLTLGNYNVTVTNVNIGCETDVPLSQIKFLIDTYYRLNKNQNEKAI